MYDLPTMEGLRLIKGLSEVPSDQSAPVRKQSETIVIEVQNLYEGTKVEDLANSLLDSRVYVGYPFLREAKVTAISDSLFRYDLPPHFRRCRSTPHNDNVLEKWQRDANGIEYELSKRCGLSMQKPIKGLKRMEDGALVKEYEAREYDYALQTIVLKVSSIDPRFLEQSAKSITEDFPEGSKVSSWAQCCMGPQDK
ncbi:hypothetical protein PCASD_05117 [Puccinia coronata f. sp. avenae]|uniref:5'-3' exoribonuclease 1 D1 domain-containing protein n=1 Tax=Puccinia coronata f. sp. avenae TaxID=200324 RepID=A0A2N5VG71_9BASI|nr:hypothetical protein PCASD_05117 [Puccinia coronata f. sp. avenae]